MPTSACWRTMARCAPMLSVANAARGRAAISAGKSLFKTLQHAFPAKQLQHGIDAGSLGGADDDEPQGHSQLRHLEFVRLQELLDECRECLPVPGAFTGTCGKVCQGDAGGGRHVLFHECRIGLSRVGTKEQAALRKFVQRSEER